MRLSIALLFIAGLAAPSLHAGENQVIDSMDQPSYTPLQGQEAKVKVELVDGHEGKALRFTFADECGGAFAQGRMRGGPEWDKAEGFSFWVKGDGSNHLGGLQFVWNEDYNLRYTFAFPIDSKDWKKIMVAWRDLIPALPGEKALPLDARNGNAPSKLGPMWVGKWFFWKDYAAHSFTLDQFQLETKIDIDDKEYLPAGAPLARVKAKLQAHQPVIIVTMGDSLTDPAHWANRETRWTALLQAELKKKYGSEAKIVNPAVGGSQLRQGLVIIPRWAAEAPQADLVTIFYGFNDHDSGMTGPQFKAAMAEAVDRARRATKGHADVLVVTTCPAISKWDSMADLAEACRAAAADKKTGIADVYAAFHAAKPEERDKLYVQDHTHLSAEGHAQVAHAVMESIEKDTTPPAQPAAAAEIKRHPATKEHPRLLGTRAELQQLAKARAADYKRVEDVARRQQAGDHEKIISLALVSAIENDAALGKQAVALAMNYVNGPIKKGHVTFGHDLALCAIAFDLCHDSWTDDERAKLITYMNATVDANVDSETSPLHNGWYGYKNWGIGMACYATYYENPRAPKILETLYKDYHDRAAPALETAGAGGGWAEGYYIHYWEYEWLFFCEVARHCEGVDLYAMAPKFYKNRAIADMFESYPGIGEYGSRRPIPMGDGGGRVFGGDRDKSLSARRILVSHYRDDPANQAVHAFNETTPRTGEGVMAYMDFLWRDQTVKKGDLKKFKLSHYSPGAGYVYARSSWDEDATYFFFKCGNRFTAHQHLENGHFLIYRREELVGDGGHYDGFGTDHDVNYHLRTIAHSTMLIKDPAEIWHKTNYDAAIRAGNVTGNDGGQNYDFPHHNGAAEDIAAWLKAVKTYDIADITAFQDAGAYLYVAGDCTRSYSGKKLEYFTRQIVYIRPGTFVIFDRVKSSKPEFKKTWLLQAMKKPETQDPFLTVTNGKGKLFVQTLLPEKPQVTLATGDDLYRYDGRSYPPQRDTGPAPECRVEVSPAKASAADIFLNVLTACDAGDKAPPKAEVKVQGARVEVTAGGIKITFSGDRVSGEIELAGKRSSLAEKVIEEKN
jgi:lysophospholipase L1-like esterase